MRRFFLALACVCALATPALGQPTTPDTTGRSAQFEAASGPPRERVPGGVLLVAAYAVAIVLLGAYVGWVASRAARVEDEVRRLTDEIERARSSGGSTTTKSP